MNKENIMRKITIEKVVVNIGGSGEKLEKGYKLLSLLTGRKPARMKSRKRIPDFGVRPGLEVGAVVTIRKNTKEFLIRLLKSVDNKLKRKQMSENNFSFGIREYIEIPGMEYIRDVGIIGLDVTVVFKRNGRRISIKKIKSGKIPKKQSISKEEIIKFMEEEFKTEFS
ncbi:MAG: 50S ribosomal protein L5 [archaeon]|nr:50S ribosomal protein L5 [archaeon]